MATSRLKVLACITHKTYFEFILLKMANRPLLNFPNLQAGSNTFCQSGEYLGTADSTKARDPGV